MIQRPNPIHSFTLSSKRSCNENSDRISAGPVIATIGPTTIVPFAVPHSSKPGEASRFFQTSLKVAVQNHATFGGFFPASENRTFPIREKIRYFPLHQ